MSSLVDLPSRFRGCLLGLAVGDGIGAFFEAQSTDWLRRRFPDEAAFWGNLPEPPYYYTDDTQMAIGVAEALLKDGGVVEQSLCEAFAANYVPSRGYGRGARIVLQAMEEGQDYRHWANELFPGGSYGNGAAMRVAPVGLRFHSDFERCREEARLSALPTHVHPLGIEGARLIALGIAIAMREAPFDRLAFLDELSSHCETDEFKQLLSQAKQIDNPDDLIELGNGIAAQESVVTAIACFALRPDSYTSVVAGAIRLGGDTDTIAAMAGAISGAHLGLSGIPEQYLEGLENEYQGRSYILRLADQLATQFETSQHDAD